MRPTDLPPTVMSKNTCGFDIMVEFFVQTAETSKASKYEDERKQGSGLRLLKLKARGRTGRPDEMQDHPDQYSLVGTVNIILSKFDQILSSLIVFSKYVFILY
jgi:hypothetical protein